MYTPECRSKDYLLRRSVLAPKHRSRWPFEPGLRRQKYAIHDCRPVDWLAFPMTMHGDAANAKACAKVLVHDWIARWGVPDVITSDRAAQFVSDLWLEICSLMGISRDTTTSYHPQHNGKVERMHRCLKNSLRARLLGRANWLSELPWVMLGLRTAANLDTGVSPSMLVTGQQPALPGQLVTQRADIDDASTFERQLSSAMAAQSFNENPWHDKRRIRSHTPRDRASVGTRRQSSAIACAEIHWSVSGSSPLGQMFSPPNGESRGHRLSGPTASVLPG